MNTYKIKLKINKNTLRKNNDFGLSKMFNDLKLLDVPREYDIHNNFCFNWALKDEDIDNCEEAYIKIYKNYYPITKDEAGEGDIVTFHIIRGQGIPTALNCKHFAIISSIYKEIKIKSKWGLRGMFESTLTRLPNIYGNYYQIWRVKNA